MPAGAGWLSLAGQVGTRADRSVPEDVGEQCEWVFRNIFAILEAAGMGPENLVPTFIIPSAIRSLFPSPR